jgi:hypothetical protein
MNLSTGQSTTFSAIHTGAWWARTQRNVVRPGLRERRGLRHPKLRLRTGFRRHPLYCGTGGVPRAPGEPAAPRALAEPERREARAKEIRSGLFHCRQTSSRLEPKGLGIGWRRGSHDPTSKVVSQARHAPANTMDRVARQPAFASSRPARCSCSGVMNPEWRAARANTPSRTLPSPLARSTLARPDSIRSK